MRIARLVSTSALVAVIAPAALGHERYEPVGKVHFPVSCNAAAQEQFDYAVALLHSFFYPETIKAFGKVAELDPGCAMAYWGMAQGYRQNPLIAGAAIEKEAWKAVQNGMAVGAKTQREKDWLSATETLFKNYDKVSYDERVKAYAQAMERLAATYPDDSEAQIYWALALDESADLSDTTLANQRKAGQILEQAWKKQPDHPGIPHYIIHSYDYAPLAEQALPAAKAYAELAPASPHAKHMPSHTFSMLGMWSELAKADESARAAWIDYGKTAFGGAAGSELHSMDFLTYGYLQMAKDQEAKRIVDQNADVTKFARKFLPLYTAHAAIPVRYAIERDDWAAAAKLDTAPLEPVRGDFPQVVAMTHFGRALGAARSGRPDDAAADIAQLETLQKDLAAKNNAYWAKEVETQRKAAAAWAAFARGNKDEAITLMRAAADAEDASKKHIAMENRLIPMRELLGDMLLEAGQPEPALKAYEASLKNAPNRFRSYRGAVKAAERAGNNEKAKAYAGKLVALTADANAQRPGIAEAKQLLAKG